MSSYTTLNGGCLTAQNSWSWIHSWLLKLMGSCRASIFNAGTRSVPTPP
ncbi:hypothetical protein K9N68_22105 [Kovacikia minuta CCNUW1]|nr:hypothetical protein [Kovacikia minuta]UBF24381.1 hypothetical protein K9N68_22105 [Kovacikia minuta CCNUW1]